jgi:hypothetical protein
MSVVRPLARRVAVAVCLVITALLAPQPVHAWGREGHRIVARIAAKNLLQTARDKLRAILGVSNAGLENAMASASIWPDLIDRDATGTERWHFINVPIATPFSVTGLCTAGQSVIAQIEHMQHRLRNNLTGYDDLFEPQHRIGRAAFDAGGRPALERPERDLQGRGMSREAMRHTLEEGS